jgi:signal transduction histidine kinase
MDAVGRLAGGIAHDFNNLLTIITSYSELALDAAPKDSPLEDKLHEILLAARRAAELTRRLLAFIRKQTQALRVVEVNQVVSNIAKMLPRLIGEDIEFTFVRGEHLGKVRLDPVQLEQVLMNLAANARCHAGGRSPANRNVSRFFNWRLHSGQAGSNPDGGLHVDHGYG